ncbi:MAG: helix-turn-helix transcriptional regulator [Novipirellula sp. JB048]
MSSKKTRAKSESPLTHKEDPILTYTDAAKMLGKHRSTISRWVGDGLLTSLRMPSGLPGVRQSEIEKLLDYLPAASS